MSPACLKALASQPTFHPLRLLLEILLPSWLRKDQFYNSDSAISLPRSGLNKSTHERRLSPTAKVLLEAKAAGLHP
jgi:hypothetical protein